MVRVLLINSHNSFATKINAAFLMAAVPFLHGWRDLVICPVVVEVSTEAVHYFINSSLWECNDYLFRFPNSQCRYRISSRPHGKLWWSSMAFSGAPVVM